DECHAGEMSHPIEAFDLYGRMMVGGRIVAQLPYAVVSPSPDRAVRFQGQAVVGAARNRHHAREPAHLNRRAAIIGRPVAQLPVIVVAPGPDGAVGFHGQTGVIPSCDSDNVHEVSRSTWPFDLDGRVPVDGSPVAQPADVVRSPGPDRAIGF